MRSLRSYVHVFGVLAGLASVSCGGSDPLPKPALPAVKAPQDESVTRPVGPVVEQEFGSIEPRDVEKTVASLASKLEACHAQGRERVAILAGDVRVFSRVGRDGRVKYQHIEESTLGDRATARVSDYDALWAAQGFTESGIVD